jgi:hypothetical protein
MIQMIPKHPETPLLQQQWRAGFCTLRRWKVSADCSGAQSFVLLGGKGTRGVSFQPVAKTGDIRSLCQRLGCQGAKDCRKTASLSDKTSNSVI